MVLHMMPGMRGMNPRQMKQAMKRLGITTEEMKNVEEVVIRADGKCYVFRNAEVTVTNMQGQKSFQIVGEPEVSDAGDAASQPVGTGGIRIPDEDVELVAAQANVSPEKARTALVECNGEPAEAIIKLMSG